MIKKRIGEVISTSFDIPLDGILDLPNAHLIGNNQLDIDGCQGIKKYEDNEIIIRCKRHMLRIKGENLSMLTFSQGRVSVRGVIAQYEIEAL